MQTSYPVVSTMDKLSVTSLILALCPCVFSGMWFWCLASIWDHLGTTSSAFSPSLITSLGNSVDHRSVN